MKKPKKNGRNGKDHLDPREGNPPPRIIKRPPDWTRRVINKQQNPYPPALQSH